MKKGKALMRRIGMLTSGGDCQSLNATMRGVAKSLYKMFDDIEIVGFEDGYKGLMYADYRIMKQSDFSGILTRGGTILGTSRQPFKLLFKGHTAVIAEAFKKLSYSVVCKSVK